MSIKVVGAFLGGIFLVALASGVKYQNSVGQRAIASVAEALPFSMNESVVKNLKIKEEFSVNCDSLAEEVKTAAESSQVVMLKFKKCDTYLNKKAVSYTIKNITNGYDGQIFKQKLARMPANLSSDYIQLQTGENIIELQISLNDGQKINKKIKINRL